MKTKLILLVLSLVFISAYMDASAQTAIVDVMGKPIQAKQYVDVQGSPYLFDDWKKGNVTLADGTTFEGMALMYDQITDEVIFRNDQGQAQAFLQPVVMFTFSLGEDGVKEAKRNFRKGYAPVDGASAGAFYEVLADGDTQLLKRYSKTIFEETPYGTATKVKKFQENTSYYVAKADKLEKVKQDKKSILNALPDKAPALEKYMKENRLNLRNDSDIIKLVDHYNSL
ncbi:hypothetical protein C8N40_10137 [Pontibacter mucosus]|uniref:Uncharacterized protein n=1 Tax=Pontibacter mucosus TaxID=1649266 RepID=A0A2T5YSC7_9BACT|nr:hypothetical protein [Pontibacter mucosus]PTX22215.1 hypothetical protein C8N40_10137 [Pontibacter mucosus]